jgi:hypothetical protein
MIDKTKFTEILPGLWFENATSFPWTSKYLVATGKGNEVFYNNELKRLYSKDSKGYLMVWDSGKNLKWHRVVYKYFKGDIPSNRVIDHDDNNKLNNFPDNLFLSTGIANTRKQLKRKTNTSGYPGVGKTPFGTFRATIGVNRKRISLGCFNTPEEAYSVYLDAKKKYHGIDSIKPLEKKEGKHV